MAPRPTFIFWDPTKPIVDKEGRAMGEQGRQREFIEEIIAGSSGLINLETEVEGILNAVNGGTGRGTLTAHAVLIGQGTSPVAFASPTTAGFVLTSNGPLVDPSFKASASESGEALTDILMLGGM